MKNFILSTVICLGLKLQTQNIQQMAPIDKALTEVSAIEKIPNSELNWVIQDSGNDNAVYGISDNGAIVNHIEITNIKNEDWEDLTSDSEGNLYIGDFGNNSEKRKEFFIYKIDNDDLNKTKAQADIITFKLPKKVKSRDFEAFFIFNNSFYFFTKEKRKTRLYSVPNSIGSHTAKGIGKLKLKGKDTKVTSADMSTDGKTIALLNHDKVWLLTDFKGNNFQTGNLKKIELNHDSQKEGICFASHNLLLLTDERDEDEDGNIYRLLMPHF